MGRCCCPGSYQTRLAWTRVLCSVGKGTDGSISREHVLRAVLPLYMEILYQLADEGAKPRFSESIWYSFGTVRPKWRIGLGVKLGSALE